VAFGDARYADLRQLLTDQLGAKGMAIPDLPDPPPFHATPPLELDLHGFGAVVFTSGFRPDYGRWVHFPAFDAMGYPLTEDGASSVVPGLFFCGVHFLRKRKSAVLFMRHGPTRFNNQTDMSKDRVRPANSRGADSRRRTCRLAVRCGRPG
jgi:putative flavoprotein involved in K+ transport